MTSEIGFEIKLHQSYEQTLEAVVEALKREGFGVLTQIDVKETMKEKLGVEFRPYTILGACNPHLAHRALTQDSVTGLMLPCNVTIEADESSGSIVRLANPEAILTIGAFEGDPVLRSIAQEARLGFERVAESLLLS